LLHPATEQREIEIAESLAPTNSTLLQQAMHTDPVFPPIKILNLNVWTGLDGRGALKFGNHENRAARQARFKALVEGLKRLQPDVIALQEVNPLPAYVRRLKKELAYDAVWSMTNAGIKIMGIGLPFNITAGNALLTKSGCDPELVGIKRLRGRGILTSRFSLHLREIHQAMAVKLVLRNRSLIAVNTQTQYSLIWDAGWMEAADQMVARREISDEQHEELLKIIRTGHRRRELEISRIHRFLKNLPRDPFVLMGDLNATDDSPALNRMMDDLKLIDAYRAKHPTADGYTWDPIVNPNTACDGSPYWADKVTLKDPLNRLEAFFDRTVPRRIDYVLLSKHFSPDMIHSARRVFTKPVNGIFASDHFGIEVVLKEIP
jgi:endonuclease/exonuclease/phosphatase family metal-dependent hydrolase